METGIVILADALGIRGIWKRTDPVKVIRRWQSVIRDVHLLDRQLNSADETRVSWRLQVFSDTIMATATPRSNRIRQPLEHIQLLGLAADIAIRLMISGLTTGFRLRGAIALGPLERSASLTLGPAIDEAAQEYSSSDWIGIHLTPNTATCLRRYCRSANDASISRVCKPFGILTPWAVPLRNGRHRRTYAVGWPLIFDLVVRPDLKPFDVDSRAVLISMLGTSSTLPLSVKRKHAQALRFYDAYAKRYTL